VLTNFVANLVTNTWLGFPFMMVVSLGALQSIPKELYEAASIDGATRWQQFKTITLPLLKPALFPAVILGTIWTFNMFNIIYLVSGGGPDNQTNILITEAYRAFKVLGRYGFAAAYSLLIFVILFLYATVTNRVTRATEGAFE
jgi:arabinogalactan oligomer/maltooligosaccharide transport system permease protein